MEKLKHTLPALVVGVALFVILPAMADLPSGYRQLEYVETDGNQWVNTLFRPTCTNAVEIKASFTNAPASAQYLYCSRNKTSSPRQGHWLYVGAGSGVNAGTGAAAFGFDDKNNANRGTKSQKVTLSVPHVFFAAPEWDGTAVTGLTGYIDGVQAGDKVPGSDFTPGDTDYFCLFGGYSSGGNGLTDTTEVDANAVCRFYYFKVWDTKDKENLLCNIVPVYGEAEQAAGLYDLVADRFLPVHGNSFISKYTLSADEDWSHNESAMGGGITVDLNGNDLTVGAVVTNTTSAFAGSDYQDLAYVLATGKQAVRITGFKLPGIARVETKIRPSVISGTQWLFCSRTGGKSNTYSSLIDTAGKLRFDFNDDQIYGNTSLVAGKDYELTFDGTISTPIWFVNGTQEKAHTATSNDFTGGSDLYLFGSSLDGTYLGRLYYFTVTTNDVIAIDLRPVRRLADGVVGLYDAANKTFYPSGTATAFPPIGTTPVFANSSETASELRVGQRLIPGYTVVECITGTGSQWIDTGLVPDSTDRVEMKASLANTTTTYGLFCSRTSSSADQLAVLYFGGTGAGIRFDFSDSSNHFKSQWVPTADEPFTVALDGNTKICYTNDVACKELTESNGFTPTANMRLFCMHSANSNPSSIAKGSIYWFRVTGADGSLKLDMIPVKRSDDVPGLYDRVNRRFCPSSADQFTAGDQVGDGKLYVDTDGAFAATEIAANITLVKEGAGSFDGGGTTLAGALKVNAGTVGGLTLLDGATLDASELSGAFSLDDNAIAFADAAKVYVNIGSRTIAKNTPVVSWTSAPSNIGGLKFRLVSSGEESDVIVKDGGLYPAPKGLIISFH